MATRKTGEKTLENRQNEHIQSASPRSSTRKRTKTSFKDEEEEDDEQCGYKSLDVLAQVASETLQSQPKRNNKKTIRMLSSLEFLNLKQIQKLSDKYLVDFYAEMSSNEMTRNFVYTCQLIPKKCQAQFKSFGNESGARMKMRNHLHKHIEQLIDEENDPKRNDSFSFIAEPVHMRTKRVTDMAPKKKVVPNKKARFTALKTNANENIPNDSSDGITIKTEEQMNERQDLEGQWLGEENSSSAKKPRSRVPIPSKELRCQLSQMPIRPGKNKNEGDQNVESDKYSREETERRLAENEQFIIELLSRTQPHHDHNYTTVFGKKRNFDIVETLVCSDDEIDVVDEEEEKNLKFYCGREIIRPKRIAEPILCLGNVSVMDELSGYGHDEASKTIIVCAEEIVGSRCESPSLQDLLSSTGHSGQKPYPPMPKCPIARHGKMTIPEEYDSASEEERRGEEMALSNYYIPKKKRKNPNELETTESERKAALKCIRELKARKRDLTYPLYCKICTDKQFTAAATLMYHYRSHAGIKPFMCLICNTTFTRQHSLNYHMLIHNNQSRFTCKDCGRKFRHPSHFKEHLRRHTGETPFVCADCPQKFKTRNTYKRHLKTRHGKLLTASGIKILTVEEFAKIRTKPYRRTPDKDVQKMVSEIKSKLEMVDNDSDVDITDSDEEEEGEITSVDDSNITIKEENEGNVMTDGNSVFIPVGIAVNS